MRSLVCIALLMSLAASAAPMPKPALLVLNKADATLAIVDPKTMKVTATVPTGAGPHEVAISADCKFAYVANYGAQQPGNSISIIDLAAAKETKRFALGPLRRPHGIVEHGGKIWFTAEANRAVGRIDPAAETLDWMMGTGQNLTHMLVISKTGTIYTANIGSDTVTVLEPAQDAADRGSGWRISQITVGKGPEGIDISPDGRELWTAHSQNGGISIIDAASKSVKQTLPALTKRSNRLKFTPDGKLVFVSDLEGDEVIVLDAAARKEVKRIRTGGTPLGIQMTPDGSRAFVALTQAGEVVTIDLKTLEISARGKMGNQPDGMAWIE